MTKSTTETPLILDRGKFLPSITSDRSRQRRRTENLAVGFLVEKLGLTPEDGIDLRKRVRNSKQPGREARKIIAEEKRPRWNDVPSGVWFEQVNDVTWKLTDGVISDPEGRLDQPTTRARAWIAGHGWAKEGKKPSSPIHWTAYRKMFFRADGSLGGDAHDISENESDGSTVWSFSTSTLGEAKRAALTMFLGRDEFAEFVSANRHD